VERTGAEWVKLGKIDNGSLKLSVGMEISPVQVCEGKTIYQGWKQRDHPGRDREVARQRRGKVLAEQPVEKRL
jgi:hypothetical protein